MQDNLPNKNDDPNVNGVNNNPVDSSSEKTNSLAQADEDVSKQDNNSETPDVNTKVNTSPSASIAEEVPSKRSFRKVNLAVLPVFVLGFFVLASASFLFYFRKTGVEPISVNNDFGYNEDFTSYELDDYVDVLVSVPEACIATDFVGELTSGWDECNYCFDADNDGIYDNPKPGEETNCLIRETICREKSVQRFNAIAPSYPDLFGNISIPSYSTSDTSESSRIAWFNWGHEVVIQAPNSGDSGHILSKGTACGMGAVCCVPPPDVPTYNVCENQSCVVKDGEGEDQCNSDNDCVIPTPTPIPTPLPTPTPIPTPLPTPTPVPTPTPNNYLSCVDNQCVEVVGDLPNECSVDADCIIPTPTPDPTIACTSLTGYAIDALGTEYATTEIPNDFVGSLNVTCTGESTQKPITTISFELIKNLDGELYKDTRTLNSSQITEVSNTSGIMSFEGTATFQITGQGDYNVSSKVCNEDNICSP